MSYLNCRCWLSSLFLLAQFFLFGCTQLGMEQPGEKTQIATVTGGVLGAGLGAIAGSASGNAGVGLVIGAAAGAGAGAMIGNEMDRQDSRTTTQSERIRRQEEELRNQAGELDHLRRLSHNPSIGSVASGNMGSFSGSERAAFDTSTISLSPPKSERRETISVDEKTTRAATISDRLIDIHSQEQMVAAKRLKVESEYDKENDLVNNTLAVDINDTATSKSSTIKMSGGADCVLADGEMKRAESSVSTADKLYHMRRALRLCPSSPVYHNAIGEMYVAMGRTSDARYEFDEALKLDPNFSAAKNNLEKLS
ncbi:MAG TPA: glycine zipper domain-containing protein [Oligoflexia bacterium]|nr:glycine zipper domain-containing protein [Oligoflexia bacterium]HMP26704.1 glycine zipper domain-containing protein [Oligoflexia bacterium]